MIKVLEIASRKLSDGSITLTMKAEAGTKFSDLIGLLDSGNGELSEPKTGDTIDAQFNSWRKTMLRRDIAALQDMLERVEPYEPEPKLPL